MNASLFTQNEWTNARQLIVNGMPTSNPINIPASPAVPRRNSDGLDPIFYTNEEEEEEYEQPTQRQIDRQRYREALRDLRCARAAAQTRACERHDAIVAQRQSQGLPTQRQGLLPDVPAVLASTGRGFDVLARDLLEEEEGDQPVRNSNGEARGRKRPSSLLYSSEQAARGARPDIIRPSDGSVPTVSWQLPSDEERDKGKEVLCKRRKLHSGSPIRQFGETDAMDESDFSSERWGGQRGDPVDPDSDGSDGENVGPTSNFNTLQFEGDATDEAPTIFSSTGGVWSTIPMGQVENAIASWRNEYGKNKPSMLVNADGFVYSALRPTNGADGAARGSHTGRHELQASTSRSSNSASGHSDGNRYPRSLPSSIFTGLPPTHYNEQPGTIRNPGL